MSLYASGTTFLAAKLMEGLYDALERNPSLDIKTILPSTEYEVCAKRFEKIIQEQPTLALVYKQSEGYSTPIPFFIKTQLSLPGRKPACRDRS